MGKIHYKWSFSIAMLNYQRVIWWCHSSTSTTGCINKSSWDALESNEDSEDAFLAILTVNGAMFNRNRCHPGWWTNNLSVDAESTKNFKEKYRQNQGGVGAQELTHCLDTKSGARNVDSALHHETATVACIIKPPDFSSPTKCREFAKQNGMWFTGVQFCNQSNIGTCWKCNGNVTIECHPAILKNGLSSKNCFKSTLFHQKKWGFSMESQCRSCQWQGNGKKNVINMRSFKTSDRKTKQDILFQDILTIVNRGVYDISSFLVRQGQVFHAQDLMWQAPCHIMGCKTTSVSRNCHILHTASV